MQCSLIGKSLQLARSEDNEYQKRKVSSLTPYICS